MYVKKIIYRIGIFTVLTACAQAQKPLFTFPLGVQAYTFRNHFPKNVAATLDSIKAMGFTELEAGVPQGMTPEDFRQLCDERGLKFRPPERISMSWTKKPKKWPAVPKCLAPTS